MSLGLTRRTRGPYGFIYGGTVILSIGLALRVAWAVAVPMRPVSDSHAYDVFAQNIASGVGYGWTETDLSAFWAVGTAAIYATVYSCFGHGYQAAVALNILVSSGVIVLTIDLARRWWSPRVGLIAGAVIAAWPLQIQFTTILASEVFFQFTILCALWLWVRRQWPWAVRAAAVGVALAATSYIRPIALLLPGLFGLWEFLECRGPRRLNSAVWFGLTSGLVMLAVIMPWSLRNQRVLGEFVLVSSNGGSNLWFGNHPGTTGAYTAELPEYVRNMSELERDKALKTEALAYIRSDPIAFARRSARKLVMLHNRETIGVQWNGPGLVERYGDQILHPLKVFSSTYWLAALALALAGAVQLVASMRLRGLLHPALLLWIYFSVVHCVTVVADRYHMPSNPFIAMLAAVALAFTWKWFQFVLRGATAPTPGEQA